MTGLEALTYFTLELTRASAAFMIEAPPVEPQHVQEFRRGVAPNVLAYSIGTDRVRTVYVAWHVLWSANKKQLRCLARHEAAHIAMQHGTRTAAGEPEERDVNEVLRLRWREPQNCGYAR